MNAAASCIISCPFDEKALESAARACRENLGHDPDLVLAFVSSDYRPHLNTVIETLKIDGHATRIAGCSGGGLLGVGRELENTCGISLLFLHLPKTSIHISTTFSLKMDSNGFLLFGNPLKTEASALLRELNTHFPGVPAAGGFATGGPEPEDLFLFSGDGLCRSSTLLVQLSGGIRLQPLVAQGCRPIGAPLIVTGAKSNEVLSIGRRKPFEVLEETFSSLDGELKEIAEGNVFAGLAIREEVEDFDSEHFLIRQIVSARLDDGRLTLGTPPRVGQTMQFQLRDAHAAERQLRNQCESLQKEHGNPFATLVCTGRGRGRRLYGAEDRDIRCLEEIFGRVPLAGIAANGEIGAVSGINFRHDHSFSGAFLYTESEVEAENPTSLIGPSSRE